MVRFGPAGNASRFYDEGFKSTLQAPGYLEGIGLSAYEYQCGRGVNVGEKTALALANKAREHHIAVSLHAPYYISMSSVEPEKRDKSVDYILQSARAVRLMGGERIVIHSGSCAKLSREEALSLAEDTMKKALAALDAEGLCDIRPCPETMGKINQLGNLDEVIALCRLDERLLPCIDFGHLNARTMGKVNSRDAFEHVLDRIENDLGSERLQNFHAHFSKIEYTSGGEKKHLTFADTVYGPRFEPLAELIYEKNLSPTMICESDGTQDIDACAMRDIYESVKAR